MALRFMDAGASLAKWDTLQNLRIETTNPRYPGKTSLYSYTYYPVALKTLDNQGTWICGQAVRMGSPTSTLFSFFDSGTCQIEVLLSGVDNTVQVRRGGPSGAILGNSLFVIPTSVPIWGYIEAKVVIHPSAGSVEVRWNGTTIINLAGVNTSQSGSSYANRVGLGTGSATNDDVPGNYYTDFYACDATGTTNNTFLGDCLVELLLPSGAGAETQWTPSAGSNYQNVDENPENGDTDYNKSNTVGQVDTYAMANLVSVAGLIYGVQYLEYARKDNAGTRTIAPVARIGGADYLGSNVNLSDSYAYTREIKELSPATAAAWTISEINAMEFGVKVTA